MGKRTFDFIENKVTGALNVEVTYKCSFILKRVDIKISTAPTTSEDLTITRDAKRGTNYDFKYYGRDLSVGSVTTLSIPFGDEYVMPPDTEIEVAYANTDGNTITAMVVVELLEE